MKSWYLAVGVAALCVAAPVRTAAAPALDAATKKALAGALDDERFARVLYGAIIDRHGRVEPWPDILGSEKGHESIVVGLYRKYGLPLPAVYPPAKAPLCLDDAYEQSIRFEKRSVDRYNAWLKVVKQTDIREAFESLRDGSDGHLYIFQEAATAYAVTDYTKSTSRTLDQVVAGVEAAAAKAGFRVTAKHDLAASLASAGFTRAPYVVVEVCDPKVADAALKAEPRLGSLMPCRIAVFEKNGKTYASTVKATRLLGLVPGAPVRGAAAKIEAALAVMIDEATQ